MRKHRIEIRSLCVLQKVNPRDFDSDDEVKARKVGSETVGVEGNDGGVEEIMEGEYEEGCLRDDSEGKICANILC